MPPQTVGTTMYIWYMSMQFDPKISNVYSPSARWDRKGPRIISREEYIQHKRWEVKTTPDVVISQIRNSPNNIKIVTESIIIPRLDSYAQCMKNMLLYLCGVDAIWPCQSRR